MDLSIVIVNWNSKEFLRKCLDSIRGNVQAQTYEVVVIDSASFDGCGSMLNDEYPEVRFIQSEINLGFARANNRAFRDTCGEFVLFLNPDTEIVGSAVDELCSNLKLRPQAGIAGARLLNSDGSLQTSCIQSSPTLINQLLDSEILRNTLPQSRLWGMAALFKEDAEPTKVDAVSGACLLIKSSVFRQVAGFSEDYFMYSEDIDLAHKVREAGWEILYVPTATVIHHGGSSSSQAPSAFSSVMMSEATLRFFLKTRGRAYAMAYRSGICLSALARVTILRLAHFAGISYSTNAQAPLEKWLALLRWSIYRDELVAKYYGRS